MCDSFKTNQSSIKVLIYLKKKEKITTRNCEQIKNIFLFLNMFIMQIHYAALFRSTNQSNFT